MNPSVLACGLAAFCASLAVHILWWRFRRPKNDIRALFVVFLAAPAAAALVYAALPAPEVWTPLETLAALLLDLSLACAYIQTYPVAQAVSPSLEILLIVERYKPEGVTESRLLSYYDDRKLVFARLQDLINTSLLIDRGGGAYALSPSARTIIRFFIAYRKLLGLEFKGG